jgi:hypothetical protein
MENYSYGHFGRSLGLYTLLWDVMISLFGKLE